MQSKQKGDLAVGKAISYFMSNGYDVCLPIGDKRPYDMIIEKEGLLARVQVKYAGLYKGKTKCTAALRVMGGNQTFYKAKKYAGTDFEYLFVYTAKEESYLFPWEDLNPPRCTVNVEAPIYGSYRVLMQG